MIKILPINCIYNIVIDFAKSMEIGLIKNVTFAKLKKEKREISELVLLFK